MKAYVELIQRRERDIGCDVLTHQTVRFPFSRSLSFLRSLADWTRFPFLSQSVVWSRVRRQSSQDRYRWSVSIIPFFISSPNALADLLDLRFPFPSSSTAAMGKGVTGAFSFFPSFLPEPRLPSSHFHLSTEHQFTAPQVGSKF